MCKIFKTSKPLFCEEYWAKRQSLSKPTLDKLSKSFELHDVNYFLLGDNNLKLHTILNSDFPSLNVQDVITLTDKEFKQLKPTKKQLTLWRGIVPYSIFTERFKKSYETKKGDVVCMPEYAYSSFTKNYAEAFAKSSDRKGILYEIMVPKGSKISQAIHCIFPRYSKFLCTDVVEKERFKLIKLKYLPKEKSGIKTFIKKMLSF